MLVIREGSTVNTKFYIKPTHSGHYLHFQKNHPLTWKEELCRVYTAELLPYTMSNRSDPTRLLLSNMIYSSMLVSLVLLYCYRQTQQKCPSEEGGAATRFYIYILYKMSLWEVQTYSQQINIKNVCKTRHSLINALMRTRPIGAPQKIADCIYSILC